MRGLRLVGEEESGPVLNPYGPVRAGLIPLKEQDYGAIASAYGEKKENFVKLLNETSAKYLPKTGGTTEKKATTGSKQSTVTGGKVR